MCRILTWLPIVLLAGCATLTPDQCRHADWRQVGFADGTGGFSAGRINDHAKACAEVGVRPDLDDYLRGREQGLRNYCQAENGFAIGRNGSQANVGDCPESMKFAFMDRYRQGQEVHFIEADLAQRHTRIHQNNARLRRDNDRIAAVREELAKKDLPEERRKSLLNEFERIVEHKNAVARENMYLLAESDRIQFHLQMKLREAGHWR